MTRSTFDAFNPETLVKADGSIDFKAADARARALRARAVTQAALETGDAARATGRSLLAAALRGLAGPRRTASN
ncbi:MAG: hypothetical protein ACFBRM_11315 [Pikeienuella sp.]